MFPDDIVTISSFVNSSFTKEVFADTNVPYTCSMALLKATFVASSFVLPSPVTTKVTSSLLTLLLAVVVSSLLVSLEDEALASVILWPLKVPFVVLFLLTSAIELATTFPKLFQKPCPTAFSQNNGNTNNTTSNKFFFIINPFIVFFIFFCIKTIFPHQFVDFDL